jgi:Ca2+-binding RTX toxin-like protein
MSIFQDIKNTIVDLVEGADQVKDWLESEVGEVNAGFLFDETLGNQRDNRTFLSLGKIEVASRGGSDKLLVASLYQNDVWGGWGNDTIRAIAPVNYLFGESGDDLIEAGGAYSMLDGGSGEDTLRAFSADNHLAGGEGDDRIEAIGGN